MIRRFLAVPAATAALLAACAAPGTSPGTGPTASKAGTVTPPPGKETLPCTKQPVSGGRSATPAPVAKPPDDGPLPSPSNAAQQEQYSGELMQRQMRANHMFLDRHPLPDAAVPGAIRCTLHAEDALKAVTKARSFDKVSIEKALTAQGLPKSTVRKPGSHDMGYGDGFTIANWTGRACIVGYVSPAHGYRVEYGSQIADGGCLPAPD
jgi:hypothetical protein